MNAKGGRMRVAGKRSKARWIDLPQFQPLLTLLFHERPSVGGMNGAPAARRSEGGAAGAGGIQRVPSSSSTVSASSMVGGAAIGPLGNVKKPSQPDGAMSLWARYMEANRNHPLTTKMITTGERPPTVTRCEVCRLSLSRPIQPRWDALGLPDFV